MQPVPKTLIEAVTYFSNLTTASTTLRNVVAEGCNVSDLWTPDVSFVPPAVSGSARRGIPRPSSASRREPCLRIALGLDKWLPVMWMVAN